MEAIYQESLINPTEESKREDAVGTASAVLLRDNREVITKELSASKPSRHDRSGGDVKDASEYRDHLSNHVHYTIQTFTSISGAGELNDMSLDRRSSYNQDKVHSCSEGFTEVDGATLSVRIHEEPRDQVSQIMMQHAIQFRSLHCLHVDQPLLNLCTALSGFLATFVCSLIVFRRISLPPPHPDTY